MMKPSKLTGQSSQPVAPTSVKRPDIYKPKVSDYKIKMLLYGDPGVGKTTLAATAKDHPLTKEVLFLNVEGGLLSVSEDAPDTIDLKDWKQMDEIFWWLASGDHNYKTVVIDSLSELRQLNLDDVVSSALSKPNNKRADMDDVFLDDYGTSNSQMKRIVRQFRDLPMHVIFTCLADRTQDKEKNEQVHPALPPKMRLSVLGYMDIVGYMYTKAEKLEDGSEVTRRILLTQPYDKWTAKDRSPGGRLGTLLEDPTIPTMIELILGGN